MQVVTEFSTFIHDWKLRAIDGQTQDTEPHNYNANHLQTKEPAWKKFIFRDFCYAWVQKLLDKKDILCSRARYYGNPLKKTNQKTSYGAKSTCR